MQPMITPIDAEMAEMVGPEETAKQKAVIDLIFNQAQIRMESESAKDFNELFKQCADYYNDKNNEYTVKVEIKSEKGSKGELIIGIDRRHKN